jgi:hypothetical protein
VFSRERGGGGRQEGGGWAGERAGDRGPWLGLLFFWGGERARHGAVDKASFFIPPPKERSAA